MKTSFLLLLAFILSNTVSAQKLYVWCPKNDITSAEQKQLSTDTINLVVSDGRKMPSEAVIECEPQTIINEIVTALKSAYPSIHFNVLSPKQYYVRSQENRLTVRVGVAAYFAGFGNDILGAIGSMWCGSIKISEPLEKKWHALTAYSITVNDLRNGKNETQNKCVYNLVSKLSSNGYRSVKPNMNSTFNAANQELIEYLNKVIQ